MKVTVRHTGGVAGLVEVLFLDTEALPPAVGTAVAAQAQAAVAGPPSDPEPQHPDQSWCEVVVEHGGATVSRAFPGARLPVGVALLVATVRARPEATVSLGPPS